MTTSQPSAASEKSPASRSDLFAFLADLGIETATLDHDAVFTVAESEELERGIPGAHTKNLFLKDAKGRLFLVIAKSDTKVDLKALPKRLGCARLSFGKPDLLLEALGVTPGSVTAFCLMNDPDRRVTAVLDEALMSHDLINAHPLENTATTSISRLDLVRFFAACGHEPDVVRLAADPG